jgi:transposase-like protein
MPNHASDRNPIEFVLETLCEHGFDRLGSALEVLLNEAMKIERENFLQAKSHERTDSRRGYANGFKPKRVKSRVGELDLKVPQVRDLDEGVEPFYPKSLERGVRSERALKLALAEMYVQGVSTRKVTEITEELCGVEVSSAQVSRAAAALDLELEAWRSRPLGACPYLVLDARYEKVRHAGSVRSCAVLVAIGVRDDGKRSVLGVSVSLSEAEVHWRDFLASLQDRGLHGVKLVTSDDHAGLRAAREARLPGVLWQRCQFHLQQNATAYVPRVAMRKEVAEALRSIFNAPDRHEADRLLRQTSERFRERAPELSAWIEASVPEALSVFALPSSHRRLLRTTNGLERLNEEIRRRTRVATLFPNESSLLRLVTAILAEVSEEWESQRTYLTMEAD